MNIKKVKSERRKKIILCAMQAGIFSPSFLSKITIISLGQDFAKCIGSRTKMNFIIIRREIDKPFTRVLKVIDIGVTNASMGSKIGIYSANLNDFAFVMNNILFELFFNNTQVSKHGCYFLFSSSH